MIELLNHMARLWWAWTASMFWQVGLLILVIAGIDLLTRKWAWPQLRYALWSLILVKLLLPPTLSLPSGVVPELRPRVAQVLQWMNAEKSREIVDSGLNVHPQFEGFAMSEGVSSVKSQVSRDWTLQTSHIELSTSAETPYGVTTNALDDIVQAAPVANPQSAINNPQLDWPFYAMTIWLLGTLILGIWLFLRLHSVAGRQGYQAAAASLPQSFYNHLADGATRLGLRRIPRVVVTKRLTSPAVFGVLSPVLLMPKGYLSKLSRRDTEHMLLHELAHIKRGDLVMHSLYLLLQIVYWYNPLLWLVRRHLHHLRELSCDGTVAELLRERTLAYRQTLLETARRMLTTSVEPGLGLLGLFEDSNYLLVRLHWLTKPTWRYCTMKRVIVATVAILIFACVLPMAQGQQTASSDVTHVSSNVTHVSSDSAVPVHTESSDNPQGQDQLSQQIAALQAQLQQLMTQQQDLQKQLNALNQKRQPTPTVEQKKGTSRGPANPSYKVYTVQEGDNLATVAKKVYGPEEGNRVENIQRIYQVNEDQLKGSRELQAGQELRIPALPSTSKSARAEIGSAPGDLKVAPPGANENQDLTPEARDQLKRAQEQAKRAQDEVKRAEKEAVRAQREAERAQRDTERTQAETSRAAQTHEKQDWGKSMQAYGDRMKEWSQSEQMKKWQADMNAWGQKMGSWGQELGRQQAAAVNGPMSGSAAPEMPPMPAMPPMPPMPAMPPISISVPEVPVPPVPTAAPEKRDGREEAVSRRDQTIELPAGTVLLDRTIDLPAGTVLEVTNEVGSINVRGTDEPGCRIVAVVKTKADTMDKAKQIADQVKLVVAPADGKVLVSMTKPEVENQGKGPGYEVALEVTVPREAQIRVSQAVGSIRLTSLSGSVEASTKVGSIQATNVSGRIALSADVGSIAVVAPKDFSAKVDAKTNIGSIQSDLPLEFAKARGVAMGSSASGTIGAGQGELSLKTNVGSIRLRAEGAERSRPAPTPRPVPKSAPPRPEPQPEPKGEF